LPPVAWLLKNYFKEFEKYAGGRADASLRSDAFVRARLRRQPDFSIRLG
jgi:hypothetical protein